MYFKITRTSTDFLHPEEPPCKEAIKKGKHWHIKIDNLADLMKFVKKYNPLVIEDAKTIEIYDDWRE